ncbi:ATP-binding protein [Flexithrix dorotheae]|uniref:ATP-binding protein n=1 Tax=Flexithrix dorotheae TaxID=70993 RepID=UPI00037E7B3C|nr:ATP-binding protein [Flexithrix dorotheae]
MGESIRKISENSFQLLNSYFIPVFEQRLDEQISFIKKCCQIFQNRERNISRHIKEKALIEIVNELIQLQDDFSAHIDGCYGQLEKNDFDENFKEFINQFEGYTNSYIIKDITLLQGKERFYPQKEDSFLLKGAKRIKKTRYYFSKFPGKVSNSFRKLFKRKTKPPKRWRHQVPMRNIAYYYFYGAMMTELKVLIKDIYLSINSTNLSVWESLSGLNKSFIDLSIANNFDEWDPVDLNALAEKFNLLSGKLEDQKKDLPKYLSSAFEKIEQKYFSAIDRVGTLELSKRKFSDRAINRLKNSLKKEYNSELEGWNNTLFTLYEDWRLDLDLYHLVFNVVDTYYEQKGIYNKKVNDNVIPQLEQIETFFNDLIAKVQNFKGKGVKTFNQLLTQEKSLIEQELTNKNLPAATRALLEQDFPKMVGQIELEIENQVQGMKKNRTLTSLAKYDKSISDKEFSKISPHELINFESLPSLLKVSKKVKARLLQTVNKLIQEIGELDSIADYNLATAIENSTTPDYQLAKGKEIAEDGLKRALARTEDIKEDLIQSEEIFAQELGEGLLGFVNKIISFTNTENIFKLKIVITKAKAINKAKAVRKETIAYIKNLIPQIIKSSREGLEYLSERYEWFKELIGLSKGASKISTEISDYLAATEEATARLPYVYQRLFKSDSITDSILVDTREEETAALKLAFDNWQLYRYVPSVVIGEKGSGNTTVVNSFLKKYNEKFSVKALTVSRQITNKEEFLQFFQEAFPDGNFTNLEDLIAYLNDYNEKMIIRMEDIQNLFLRMVGGFIGIKYFVELMSKTNKKHFWICTCTVYAWNYLDKALDISDYFGYTIRLKELTSQKIADIILKRHKMSGYNIFYKPDPLVISGKKLAKMDQEESQAYLKEDYFSFLNKFTGSNISLALIFWMRSTEEILEDTINISTLRNLDFSFLNALSTKKIFLLHALLIHDGLTQENYARILNQGKETVRQEFTLLFDDGLIIYKNDHYFINPLLYSQIVILLKAKNLIY